MAVLSNPRAHAGPALPISLQPVLKPASSFSIPLLDFVYKTNIKPSERPVFKSSRSVAAYLQQTWDENKLELQEQFKVIVLNRANIMLGIFELCSGGHWRTCAEPKWVFAAALLANACNIIITHNHPSGQAHPSAADIAITEKIKLGGRLLDIKLLDHIIITKYAYYSFADEKLI